MACSSGGRLLEEELQQLTRDNSINNNRTGRRRRPGRKALRKLRLPEGKEEEWSMAKGEREGMVVKVVRRQQHGC